MSTTNRIVLLNRRGEELFSGDSMLTELPPPPTLPRGEEPLVAPAPIEEADADEEPIPATLRSSVLLLAHEPVSRPIIIDEVERTPRNDEGKRHRAA
jgi:hypothetical protein